MQMSDLFPCDVFLSQSSKIKIVVQTGPIDPA